MKKLFSIIIFFVGVLIVYKLLQSIDIQTLGAAFQNISWRFVALGFGFYILTNVLRAWRAHILLKRSVPTGFLLWITVLQNTLNTFLPFGTGEAFYVGALKSSGYSSLSRGTVSLIGGRVLDFLCLFFIMLISVVSLVSVIPHARQWIILLSILIALVIGGMAVVLFVRPAFVQRWEKLQKFIEGFQILRARHIVLPVFLYSCAIWICLFSADIALLWSVDLHLSPLTAVFVISLPMLANFIPASFLGSYGIFEGSALIGFTIVGVSRAVAIPASFVVHTQSLAMLLIMAGIAWLAFSFHEK